jgi:glycosyltransferase involved in cell wall biosynthesis
MKVLFGCQIPFSLAHGGMQIQIEETIRALNAIGVFAEPLRWWDDQQSGDILHHIARPSTFLVQLAQRKGMKVVISDLLTGQGSRPNWRLTAQKFAQRIANKICPRGFVRHFNWDSYDLADACIALTAWEAELLGRLYDAPRDRTFVVANGVESAFFDSKPATRGRWLVCTATITERKRVLELAEAAVDASTPLWVIGKPYSPDEPYAKRFLELTRRHPNVLRFEGPINERSRLAAIYREARGFVLLSAMESLSISALEAAACECPLLLSDLPWARSVFGEHASYCPITSSRQEAARYLRRFYDQSPTLKPPPKPLTWIEIAQQLKVIYERVLKTSR